MWALFRKWSGAVGLSIREKQKLLRFSAISVHNSRIKYCIMAAKGQSTKSAEISAKACTSASALPPLKKGTMRLYSMRFCPFAHRARLVLAHKNIPYETVNIHLKDKPLWYPEKNLNGEVPVLEKDGLIVFDSLVVAEYLDGVFKESPLMPTDSFRRAQDTMIINYNGNKFVSNYYKVLATKGEDETVNKDLMTALDNLEKFLAERTTLFFGGDNPAYIDFMIWPWHERFPLMECYKIDTSLASCPNLKKWCKAMSGLPAVKACAQTIKMHTLFIDQWKAGDPDAFDVGLPN